MKRKGAIIVALFAVAFAAVMITSTQGLSAHRVEVCVEYEGRTACRTASAATPDKAKETATVNACAQIASGMTDSMRCQGNPPTKVTWMDRK